MTIILQILYLAVIQFFLLVNPGEGRLLNAMSSLEKITLQRNECSGDSCSNQDLSVARRLTICA